MKLPYRTAKKKRISSFILIGDGFDEYEVICFIHKFRQQGLKIKSVSLFDKLVYSRQGVGLKTDFALADQPFDRQKECILILPSGGVNGDRLRRDARVRMLLEEIDQGDGRVVLTDSESQLAIDVEQLMSAQSSCLSRIDERLEDFVDMLANRLVYAN